MEESTEGPFTIVRECSCEVDYTTPFDELIADARFVSRNIYLAEDWFPFLQGPSPAALHILKFNIAWWMPSGVPRAGVQSRGPFGRSPMISSSHAKAQLQRCGYELPNFRELMAIHYADVKIAYRITNTLFYRLFALCEGRSTPYLEAALEGTSLFVSDKKKLYLQSLFLARPVMLPS